MSADLKGYYILLGVSPMASEAEINTAYRKRAKESHPDTTGNADGGTHFSLVSEAYRILNDRESRAKYDSLSATAEATANTRRDATVKPIACSSCGQITAQPRYVAFRHVISFVLGTVRTPTQGIFCARCARSKALRATAISAITGWWGIPWGPIWTILEGGKNAFGGYTSKAANENLLWHNAIAFSLRGDNSLSLALADKLRSAEDRDIASNAAKLIEHFKARGVTLGSKTLKDPWALHPTFVAFQLLMIAAAPAALATVIFLSSTRDTGGYQGYASGPSTYSARTTGSLYADPPTGVAPVAEPAPAPKIVPACKSPPKNGKVLAGSRFLESDGHILDINNGSSGDAIVKLRRADTLKLAASFFIQSNQSATLQGIPDGTYIVQYAFGPILAEDCKSFTAIDSVGQFPVAERFVTERSEDSLGITTQRMHLSYTLYAVPGGNTRPNTINEAAFDAS